MTLLKDDQLQQLATGNNPIVVGLPRPPTLAPHTTGGQAPNPWLGGDSAIQASSIDIHIGKILLPDVEDKESGSVENPKSEFSLQLGHTVVVVSSEKINLPINIAAFGFPPAKLSSRGLLMTNPGHVDPGYIGPLRFTIMNIGKESILLRKGDPIVTLLFFQLSGNASAGYADRKGLTEPVPEPTQEEVNRLSLDFLDVTDRANEAAKKAVEKAEFRAKYLPPTISAGATIIVALVVGFFGLWKPLDRVQAEMVQIKEVLGIKENLKSRIDKIDDIEKVQNRIGELEKILDNNVKPNNTEEKR